VTQFSALASFGAKIERRFIEDGFACRTGKGTHAGMRRAAEFARRFDYALKCDVRQYFPHVDHGVLLELLRRVIGDRRVLELCENILASHRDRERRKSCGADRGRG